MLSPHTGSVSPSASAMRGDSIPGRKRSMAPNRAIGVFARRSPARKSAYSVGNWSGIRLIDSMPPASTSRASPAAIRWQAFATDSMPEAQFRCEFAASAGIAQWPNTTSSIRPGSRSLRAMTSAAAILPSS